MKGDKGRRGGSEGGREGGREGGGGGEGGKGNEKMQYNDTHTHNTNVPGVLTLEMV